MDTDFRGSLVSSVHPPNPRDPSVASDLVQVTRAGHLLTNLDADGLLSLVPAPAPAACPAANGQLPAPAHLGAGPHTGPAPCSLTAACVPQKRTVSTAADA